MLIDARFKEVDSRVPRRAMLEGAWRVSWQDALRRSRLVAGFLHGCGVVAGDHIAIATRDEGEAHALLLGCLRAGVVPLFIDPRAKAREVAWLLTHAKPVLMLADEDRIVGWQLSSAAPGIDVWPITKPLTGLVQRWLGGGARNVDPHRYPQCLDQAPDTPRLDGISSDHAALILYTSGTTGGQKLVSLSRGNLIAQAEAMAAGLELHADARVLNLMPLAHVDGLVTGAFLAFWLGSTTIRLEPFTIGRVPEILDAVHKHRASHAVLVPTLLALLMRLGKGAVDVFRAPEFQVLISTASAIPDSLWIDVEAVTGKPVVNMYGMSEIGNVCFAGPGGATRRVGTIGRAVGCETLVVDDAGQPVGTGEMGELLVSGATVSAGYLNGHITRPIIGDTEWFATGDVAVVEEDAVIRLVGRKKELVITGGHNVAPDEVNQVLLEHAAVREAATFGVPHDTWGERVVACVVKEGDVSASDLMDLAARRLSEFKIPRAIQFVDELPRGRTGKVQVDLLRERFAAGAADALETGSGTLECAVVKAAARSFRIAETEVEMDMTPESCFTWDSMAHLEFAVQLETAFEVELTPAEILRIDSIRRAVEILQKRRAAAEER